MTQQADEKLAMTQSEMKPLTNGSEGQGHTSGEESGKSLAPEIQIKIRKSDPNVLVLDSFYGWVVCFGSFVIYCLAAAFNRALTISFLDFVEIFDVSITTTSLSFTFLLVAISISALLVMNLLVPLTGERVAVVAGCIGNSLCTFGVGFSPNITVFLMCMAGKGLCTGTAFVPAIAMISQYFEKRRSLATSLAYCGLGVGSMVAPPVVEYLKENYGLLGMFLIVGALELNAVPAAMLLRPISNYKYVISSADSETNSDTGDEDVDTDDEKKELTDKSEADNTEKAGLIRKSEEDNLYSQKDLAETAAQPAIVDKDGVNEADACDPELQIKTESAAAPKKSNLVQAGQRNTSDSPQVQRKPRSLSFKDESTNVYQDTTEPLILKEPAHRPPLMGQLSVDAGAGSYHNRSLGGGDSLRNSEAVLEEADDSYANRASPNTGRRYPKPSPSLFLRGLSNPGSISAYGAQLPDVKYMSSTWSLASAPMCEVPVDVEVLALESVERRSQMSGLNRYGSRVIRANSVAGSEGAANETEKKKKKSWLSQTGAVFRDMFSKELLKTWSLPILLIGSSAGSLVQYLLAYLPTLASKQGMDASQVSILLTVSGAVELVSRILIGFFTDLNILTPGQVVAIAQICIGTTMHFVYFFTDYNSLMIFAIIVGIFGNTRQNLATLVTIEFMGLSRFRRALGFQAMSSTLSLAIHHPLLSAVLEATGSFAVPLHYVGVSLYIAAALMLMAPLTKKWDQRAEARKKQRLEEKGVA